MTLRLKTFLPITHLCSYTYELFWCHDSTSQRSEIDCQNHWICTQELRFSDWKTLTYTLQKTTQLISKEQLDGSDCTNSVLRGMFTVTHIIRVLPVYLTRRNQDVVVVRPLFSALTLPKSSGALVVPKPVGPGAKSLWPSAVAFSVRSLHFTARNSTFKLARIVQETWGDYCSLFCGTQSSDLAENWPELIRRVTIPTRHCSRFGRRTRSHDCKYFERKCIRSRQEMVQTGQDSWAIERRTALITCILVYQTDISAFFATFPKNALREEYDTEIDVV